MNVDDCHPLSVDAAKWLLKMHQMGGDMIALRLGLYDTHCATTNSDIFSTYCAGTSYFLVNGLEGAGR